jgi:hypothetical protein
VLQVGQIGIDLLQGSDLSLHGCCEKKKVVCEYIYNVQADRPRAENMQANPRLDETFSDLIYLNLLRLACTLHYSKFQGLRVGIPYR